MTIKTLKGECEEQKRQKIEQKLMLEKQKSTVERESTKIINELQKQNEKIK